MYKKLIINYINNKLTVNDIDNFSINNNIQLKDNENKIIYNFIKNNYNELLNKNDEVFKKLKVSDSTFKSCIQIYNKYKNKI